MSASRERSKLKSRAEKARRKAAKRALYQSFAEAGRNIGSKRAKMNGRRNRSSPTKHLHLISNCGNAGCKRCFAR